MVLRTALPVLLAFAGQAFAQQDAPRFDCCFHILSVGANLAWAEALSRASIPRTTLEGADNTILANLDAAANHAEAAMTVCSRINPVRWQALPSAIRRLAAALRQSPVPDRRAAVTSGILDLYQSYKPLNSIVLDTTQGPAETCEGLYYRMAWHVAAVVQYLRIVQSARNHGIPDGPYVENARNNARAGLSLVNAYNARDCAATNLSTYWSALTRVAQEGDVAAALPDAAAAWDRFQHDVSENCSKPPGVLDGRTQAGFCVLRKPVVPTREDGQVCYEFYLANTSVTDASRMATIALATDGNFRCFATSYAWRSHWEIEPSARVGPFRTWQEGDAAMSQLSSYQRDVYRCFTTGPIPTREPQPVPVWIDDSRIIPPPPPPQQRPPAAGSITISGTLNPATLAALAEWKRARGNSIEVSGSPLTVSIGPNGACTITSAMNFESLELRNGKFLERVVKNFQLSEARSQTPDSCNGGYSMMEDWTPLDGKLIRTGPHKAGWYVSRQPNGTWKFTIPNGKPPSYGDIDYLLR